MSNENSPHPDEFPFPDPGEGVPEAKLLRWRVRVGQRVNALDPLAEMETVKAVVEVPSPRTGIIKILHSAEGQVVKPGAAFVTFQDGSVAAATAQQTPPTPPPAVEAPPPVPIAPRPRKKRRPPPGSPPGTLPNNPTASPAQMRLIAYGPQGTEECSLRNPDQLKDYLLSDKWPVVWLDVDGVGDQAVLEAVGEAAGLHRLSLADVANTNQRPKVEDFGTYLFVVLRAPIRVGGPDQPLETEQISLCLGKGFVLSFQEANKPGDSFDRVRDRIRKSSPAIREKSADYLLYALMDAAIDAYFPLLENLGEQLDELENAAMQHMDPATMRRLHQLRREFLTVRRAAWPLREAVGVLHRDSMQLVTDSTRVYFRDCYDHTVQIIDLVETGRELGTGLMEMHLTMASHRMNEIMKVLTIITTIFIPLSFIAGIYGMNFDTTHPLNMPLLRWKYGYITIIGVMALIAAVMVYLFWRNGWIAKSGRRNRK